LCLGRDTPYTASSSLAPRAQLLGEALTKAFSAGKWPAQVPFDPARRVGRQHGAPEGKHLPSNDRGGAERHLAAAAERAQQSPFAEYRVVGRPVIELDQQLGGQGIIGPALQAQRPLTDGGQHPGRVKNLGDHVSQAQAL
jgi:hypothetical protein